MENTLNSHDTQLFNTNHYNVAISNPKFSRDSRLQNETLHSGLLLVIGLVWETRGQLEVKRRRFCLQ